MCSPFSSITACATRVRLSAPRDRIVAHLIRVGHKGADALAPGNTAASFDAAIATGVDMIEFDVLPDRDGQLVLAHDPADAAGRRPLTLAEGLDHLAALDVSLDVDLKLPGYEQRVLDELGGRDLLDRSVVSTMWPQSLQRLTGVRRGWSVPRATRDWTRVPLAATLARGALVAARRRLPDRAAIALRAGRCEAVMAHRLLITRALVERVQEEGGELYVWTVDDAEEVAALRSLGVDGVISNDPRTFV